MNCPECAGPQMVDHPAGILMIRHTNSCSLRASEDSRLVADYDRNIGRFTRLATPTERTLLIAFGYVVPDEPDELATNVQFLTPGVRLREWPDLKLQVQP